MRTKYLLHLVWENRKMSSEAEVAQTHSDSDADPVLDYVRKGETQYYLNGLHCAVNNFITVFIEQRGPSKAHTVANAPKSPHSCQKLNPRLKAKPEFSQ